MKQPHAPCKHCPIRQPACQTSCLQYAVYSAEYIAFKELVDKARDQERNINDFKYERVTALKQRIGR